MGKVILITLVVILLAHCLALVGLVGYGAATGRLDQAKIDQYLATWRGQELVPPPPEEEETQEQESPQQAAARIAQAEEQGKILTLEMQRQLELLRDMKFAVEAARAKLQKDLAQLEKNRAGFEEKLAQQQNKARDENFQKALRNYSQMKPKYVKNDFMAMDENDAVRYLAAMKPDTATKVLNYFKTDEEQEKRRRLMKLLEQEGVVALNETR